MQTELKIMENNFINYSCRGYQVKVLCPMYSCLSN